MSNPSLTALEKAAWDLALSSEAHFETALAIVTGSQEAKRSLAAGFVERLYELLEAAAVQNAHHWQIYANPNGKEKTAWKHNPLEKYASFGIAIKSEPIGFKGFLGFSHENNNGQIVFGYAEHSACLSVNQREQILQLMQGYFSAVKSSSYWPAYVNLDELAKPNAMDSDLFSFKPNGLGLLRDKAKADALLKKVREALFASIFKGDELAKLYAIVIPNYN